MAESPTSSVTSSPVIVSNHKKRYLTFPWQVAVKGAVCGILVASFLWVGAIAAHLAQSSLFVNTSGGDVKSEWIALLAATFVILTVAFCGIGLPILMLRGARLRHYVCMFAAEIFVIIATLLLVYNMTDSVSTNGENTCGVPTGDLCTTAGPGGVIQ